MAILEIPNGVKRDVRREGELLERKRELVSDDKWKPAKGAGMIPEDEWKQYSPESKDELDYEKGAGDDV